MAKKKKGGKSVKGSRPAVLSLGKKVAKAPARGKKTTMTRGKRGTKRINVSGKARRTTYKRRSTTKGGY